MTCCTNLTNKSCLKAISNEGTINEINEIVYQNFTRIVSQVTTNNLLLANKRVNLQCVVCPLDVMKDSDSLTKNMY